MAPFATTSKGDLFSVTNLVTDDQAVNPAQITDTFLTNPWGISHSAGSPFWVSDNGTGVATLYQVNPTTNATTKMILGSPPDPSGGVVIPPPGAGTPTGQVFNTISADGVQRRHLPVRQRGRDHLRMAECHRDHGRECFSSPTPITSTRVPPWIRRAGTAISCRRTFVPGTIDVLKGDAGAPDLAGKFTDPGTPNGFAPFNIQVLGNRIYVTYALQDAAKHDDVAGAGNGFVTAFDLQGNFLGRIGSMGTLNSPWGLAIAPSSFKGFAGDLLVGNFGDGTINVFNPDPATPGFLGQLTGADGKPIVIDGLWGLIAGQ